MIFIHEIDDTDLEQELAKALCWPIDLYDCPVIVEVEYKVYGRYYPATFFEPEEFPEMEITSVEEIEIEIGNVGYKLHEKQIKKVEDLLISYFADKLDAAIWEDYCNKDWSDDYD